MAVHCGSNRDSADALAAELPGEGHVVVQGDLRDAAAVEAFVDDAALRLGGLDVLVNNAGVYSFHSVDDVDYETWQQAWADTLGVNLVGAANATYCALKHLPRDGSARIVNVGSRGAFRGEPDAPAYAASKAGLTAFGQSLAKALGGTGVSVTTVAPGFVETDMAAFLLEGPEGDAIRGQSPLNRVASPEEIADAVRYLASPGAQWATGTVLDLNGASHLRL